MRTLILQNMVIPTTAWEELATARVQAVRDYLLLQGVDAQRVFWGRFAEKRANPDQPICVTEHFCPVMLGVFAISGENTR